MSQIKWSPSVEVESHNGTRELNIYTRHFLPSAE